MELAEAASAGVGTVRSRTSRISQLVTLLAVVVPPLGLGSAMGLLWGVAFHWADLVIRKNLDSDTILRIIASCIISTYYRW